MRSGDRPPIRLGAGTQGRGLSYSYDPSLKSAQVVEDTIPA